MDLENPEHARDVTINLALVVQEDAEVVLVALDIIHLHPN
jgi:hypothetical protein